MHEMPRKFKRFTLEKIGFKFISDFALHKIQSKPKKKPAERINYEKGTFTKKIGTRISSTV